MIRKKGDRYHVLSEKGKHLGDYASREEAEKRLRQIEYFKHVKKSLIEKVKKKQMLKKSIK